MKFSMAEYIGYLARHNKSSSPIDGVSADSEPESELHDKIEQDLKHRGLYYVHSRTDRATTQRKGVTDFIIAAPNGQTHWIEVKGAKTKVTPEQAGTIAWLETLAHKATIVISFDEYLKALA